MIALGTIAGVLLLDQLLKFYIKLHYHQGESTPIFSWFQLYFIENEGMAFGLKWGGNYGKILLTTFRIIFVSGLGYYLVRLIKRPAHKGYIFCMCLIFAGAMGNIIDSVFYGLIFSSSTYAQVAHLFPAGGGYAPVLKGQVVDMLYFPLYHGILPKWIPFVGGREFSFFDAIFNISDASISIGVFLIVIFQNKFFRRGKTARLQEASPLPDQAPEENGPQAN